MLPFKIFFYLVKFTPSTALLLDKLKRIDLTSNNIATIEDETFVGLPALAEVVIRENHISQLPGFPPTMMLIDASYNNIGSKGIHHEAFKVSSTHDKWTADCCHS